ncbi:MAG: zf-HC2 domain-containing protein [Planctomycetota bacterium]
MSACKEIRDQLSALLDAELAGGEAEAVEKHLESCERCGKLRSELAKTRQLLAATFRESIARAPAPSLPGVPSAPLRPGGLDGAGSPATVSRHNRQRLIGALSGIAAIIILGGILSFFLQERVGATPTEVMRRAADRYLGLEDVELWITLESQAIDILEWIFGDGDESAGARTIERILIKAPNRFLLESTTDVRLDWGAGDGLSGWDGEVLWEYDPRERVVHACRPGPGELTFESEQGSESIDLAEIDLLRFFSWDFVRQLNDAHSRFEVREISGPSSRRSGRRIIEVTPRPDEAEEGSEESGIFMTKAILTIDPAEDLIEKMVIDVRLAVLSLVRLQIEVAAINQAVADSFFHYRAHVPAGTRIKEDPPPEKRAPRLRRRKPERL